MEKDNLIYYLRPQFTAKQSLLIWCKEKDEENNFSGANNLFYFSILQQIPRI